MGTVLIPIPDRDFDPTEVAVSWQVLRTNGHRVVFATESGAPGIADDIMVTGRGLDFWSALPVLGAITVVGRALRANKDARGAYREMLRSPEYQNPSSWAEATLDGIDGLLLPGGHRARGMRSYIDSETLHRLVVDAFGRGVIVAAICHGVLLAARSVDPTTGHSVLYGRRTTALTWALERTAWRLSRITRFWDRDYYRTYSEEPGQPSGYMSVQSEVTRALKNSDGLLRRRARVAALADENLGDGARYRNRFAAGVRRRRRRLRVGALAGRHPHVRKCVVAEALTSAQASRFSDLISHASFSSASICVCRMSAVVGSSESTASCTVRMVLTVA